MIYSIYYIGSCKVTPVVQDILTYVVEYLNCTQSVVFHHISMILDYTHTHTHTYVKSDYSTTNLFKFSISLIHLKIAQINQKDLDLWSDWNMKLGQYIHFKCRNRTYAQKKVKGRKEQSESELVFWMGNRFNQQFWKRLSIVFIFFFKKLICWLTKWNHTMEGRWGLGRGKSEFQCQFNWTCHQCWMHVKRWRVVLAG